MKQSLWLVVLVAASVQLRPAGAQLAPAGSDIPVMLSKSDQQRLGVASASLPAREIQDSVDAVVQAVDPAPLAQLDADLAAAAAAATASASELRRTAGLAAQDRSASQQALEAARMRAAADTAALTALERRLAIEWGPAFTALTSAERAELIGAVAEARAALLRADAPGRPGGVEGRVLIDTTAGGLPVEAVALGFSGSAETRMQTVGLYCVVRGAEARAMRPGRTFAGRIETETMVTGTVLPRSALVRLDGSVWAYVKTGEETFVRREVLEPRLQSDGWFVTQGFPPGTELVVGNAGSLVAVERGNEALETD